MFRILHISDLHVVASGVGEQTPTLLQNLIRVVGAQKFQTEVNAKAWDSNTLESLKNCVRDLSPQMIVVTGDLSNYGDPDSLAKAFKIIAELKAIGKSQFVLCVPGNHDTLVERSLALRQRRPERLLLHLLSAMIGEVDAITMAAERSLTKSLRSESLPSLNLTPEESLPTIVLPFLNNYIRALPDEIALPDPGVPVEIPLEWGTGLFFLINSNGSGAVMANEGFAGPNVFNAIDRYRTKNQKKFESSLKFAILHHHPMSAPQTAVGADERAYNWMKDGPLLLQFLHERDFRFVLHGHEHIPFDCTVNYSTPSDGLHIVAAGSALQQGSKASFNVLDLDSAYVAHRHRWMFDKSAFAEDSNPLPLTMRTLEPLRADPSLATADDASLYNLLRADFDRGNNYDSFFAVVELTDSNNYKGRYRYKGRVITETGGLGVVVTLTGDPPMKWDDMKLRGVDNITSLSLNPFPQADHPYQKIVQFKYLIPLNIGAPFDITIEFEWQATAQTPHCWDGFNLGDYRGPLKRFDYDITIAQKPAQFDVVSRGLNDRRPAFSPRGPEQLPNGAWHWGFMLDQPEPVATLIYFHLPNCPHSTT